MHRTGSTTRASDEMYLTGQIGRSPAMEIDKLPTYDPQSGPFKKEAGRLRLAENMVHLIPLVLILCALVLWFFSYPEIILASKDDSIIARAKNMTIGGYSTWNSSSMANVDTGEDMDPIDGIGMEDPGKDLGAGDPA